MTARHKVICVAVLSVLLVGFACTSKPETVRITLVPESPTPSPTSSPPASPASAMPATPTTLPPTLTISATPTVVPSVTEPTSTPRASYPAPEFVQNSDCENIDRTTLPLADVTIETVSGAVNVVVEVASLPAQRQQGLMCRSVAAAGTGMIFTWPNDYNGGFWMFNTYVPLDIIYFGGSGQPVLRQMAPCPREAGEDDGSWRSRCITESSKYGTSVPYRNALELPQGWLAEQGINTDAPKDFIVSFVFRD